MTRLTKFALLFVGAALVAGQIYAQPAPAVKVDAQVQVKLTPEEMKKQAQDLRDKVRADLQRIQHLQALARKDKDVIKLSCVNDKFIKLKAEANLFDTAHRELLGVLDNDSRFSAFASVTKSASDVRKAREEADVCVGQTDLAAGTANDVTAPDIIDDPTLGLPFDIEVEPPAYASPYI